MRILYWASVILASLTAVQSAGYNIDEHKEPNGNLKVQLDRQVALKTRSDNRNGNLSPPGLVFTSVLEFKEDVGSIDERQLFKMAADAYLEIEPAIKQYGFGPRPNRPHVMFVLAIGNQIILASSMTQRPNFMVNYGESVVKQSLLRCQVAWNEDGTGLPDEGHRNGASCGEVMAAHLWYRMHKDQKRMPDGGRALAVRRPKDGENGPQRMAACGSDEKKDTWGCKQFIADGSQRLKELNPTEKMDYDLNKLAGGLLKAKHFSLCS